MLFLKPSEMSVQSSNIELMSVTIETSQLLMFWSKLTQSLNIELMSVTFETSQPVMSCWLRPLAPSNIDFMFVTYWTSQVEMSQVSMSWLEKMPSKLVNPESNNQVLIGPYTAEEAG